MSEHRTVSPPGSRKPPRRRVERREQTVLDEDTRRGDAVQERRLARVRVADERDGRHGVPPARLALRRARLAEALQVLLELRDALLDAAAVDLELRLPGPTPGPDATGLLAQLAPPPPEPGKEVPVLRELDLHHPLLARRVLGEDVEDQGDAVDDVAFEQLLEVALLGGRQLVVEDDDVDVERLGELVELLGLPRPHVRRRVGPVAPLQDASPSDRPRRCR